MSNLSTLIKVSLRESLDLRKNKKVNKKTLGFGIYILIIGIVFTLISCLYNFIFISQFALSEEYSSQINLYVLAVFGIATVLTFSTSITRMQTVFVGKDYELLSSLPIKKRDIVLSKILSLYVSELLYSLVILVPCAIMTAIFGKNLLFLLIIPLAFVSPAYAMLLGLLVVSLINLLIKNKRARDIISGVLMTIFMVAFIGYMFYFSFASSLEIGEGEENAQVLMLITLANKVGYINPSLYFIDWGFGANPLWLLVYLASNFILLALVLIIVSLFYNKIHQNMSMTAKVAKRKTKYRVRSQFKQIMSETVSSFFRSKTFFIQSFLGVILSILMLAGGIVMLRTMDITNDDGEFVCYLYEFMHDYAYLVVIGITMFTAIVPPSSVAISLEGEKFFVLKSTPIDFKKYVLAKVLFSSILLALPITLASIVYVIIIPQSVISIIACLLFPMLFSIATSCFSLFINIKMPFLHYDNEIEVFKNHKSTLITAFADMLGSNITLAIGVILAIFSPIISIIVILILYIGLDILFGLLVFKNGVKSLYNFEEN